MIPANLRWMTAKVFDALRSERPFLGENQMKKLLMKPVPWWVRVCILSWIPILVWKWFQYEIFIQDVQSVLSQILAVTYR